MRLLLALIALLTGLSMPNVAFATSHAEVAEAGGVAAAIAPMAAHQQAPMVRCGDLPRYRGGFECRTVGLPTLAFGRKAPIALSDRPLE